MLRDIRSSISSWSVRILLTLIIVSFIASYGFRGSKDGMAEGVVATVGHHEITERDLHMRFQGRLQSFARFFKGDLPPALLENLRYETLNEMIDEQLYSKAAHDVGLVSAENEVRDSIRRQFNDEAGNFDFDRYQKIVRSVLGKTTGTYEKEESTRLLSEHFQELLTRTAWASDADLRRKYEENQTRAVLSYVKLDADRLRSRIQPNPTASELEAYYKAHAKKYEIPEKTSLDIAWVALDQFAIPTEPELRKILGGMPPQKAQGVRLRAAHILVKGTDEAAQKKRLQEVQAKLARGESFETLAAQYSEDGSKLQGGDLGYFGEKDMVPPFEKAALALRPGQISGPVKSEFGLHLIKLYDKIPAGEATLERLKPELTYVWTKKTFEHPKKLEKITKQAEALLEAFKAKAATAPFSEVSESKVHSIRTALVSKDDPIPGLPSGRDASLLLSSVGALEMGRIGNPVRSLSNRYLYLVKKTDSRPAATPEFASVRAAVTADYLSDKLQENLSTFAKTTLERALQSGQTIEALAKSLGLALSKTQPFGRPKNNAIPGLGASSVLAEKAFVSPVGTILNTPIAIGKDLYYVRVESRTSPDWNEFEAKKEDLRAGLTEEISRLRLEAWSHYLRSKTKVKQKV